LLLAIALPETAGCGKPCDLWSFHSRCEGNVAPQCLGDKLAPYRVVRVDCTASGEVCANPESGEHAREAFCFPTLGTCDPRSFVPRCSPRGQGLRCVRDRIIESGASCTPEQADGG
jgi:hypothetical protein